MLFDYRKVLANPAEAAGVEASLDEYLALEGDALSRLRFKRRGAARQAMTSALAQMSMLFAAAKTGAQDDFDACLDDVKAQAALDEPAHRALREFYLRNISRIPGVGQEAVARLALARPILLDLPLAAPQPAEAQEG